MGDPRRFDLFAKLIERHVPRDARIADVAGGKGVLRWALRERGYRNVVSIDKRRGNAKGRHGLRYGHFDAADDSFDAAVGMHPDEATDHLVLWAARTGRPTLVVPCCVKPSAVPFWGRHNAKGWRAHLLSLAANGGARITETALSMNGASYTMILNSTSARDKR